MKTFRFIHAADIHIDSPLRGFARYEGASARFGAATRTAFANLVDRAIEERVAFMVIAGDLYDGDWRDYNTGLFFAGQAGRLNEAGIPVFVLHGNHDAESQITRRLTLPDNVRVFGARQPESFELDGLHVVLHGQSFAEREVRTNLVPAYPAPVPGRFNIGVLHTALGGMGGHENYAPCALEELLVKGYQYWALGHVHQAQILNERPHVVFPGVLQGRHIRETGPKGAFLVNVEDGEVTALEPLRTDVVRWALLRIDVARAGRIEQALGLLRERIAAAVRAEADGRLLVCRLELHGQSAVHAALIADQERLLEEARAIALGLGEDVAWVEKLVVATGSALPPQVAAEQQDALAELRRIVRDTDPELLDDIARDVGELLRRVPHAVREDLENPALQAALAGDYAPLAREATDYLLARLTTDVS